MRPESLAIPIGASGTLGGVAAGEPLHFAARTDGSSWALAAIPLSAKDSFLVQITVADSGRATDTIPLWLPVAPLVVDTDRLRTPAEFTRPPDSAVAARAEREGALVRAVFEQSHQTARLWRERFSRPVRGRVTSGFGVWRVMNGVAAGRHTGVDLAGHLGAPVHAANRGVVALVADLYYGGLTVIIDHGGGLVTTYAHLSRALVAVGDTVRRGQPIARLGETGRATGPHLHWGAHYGGVAVDARSLLTLAP